jgi:molecular chaperone DnaK
VRNYLKNKVAVEYALTESMALKIPAVQTALDNINAWKTATEAMYAQGEQGQGEAKPEVAQGDDVQDVDYEEVK